MSADDIYRDARSFVRVEDPPGRISYTYGDGYFDAACERKYGHAAWSIAKQQAQRDVDEERKSRR